MFSNRANLCTYASTLISVGHMIVVITERLGENTANTGRTWGKPSCIHLCLRKGSYVGAVVRSIYSGVVGLSRQYRTGSGTGPNQVGLYLAGFPTLAKQEEKWFVQSM